MTQRDSNPGTLGRLDLTEGGHTPAPGERPFLMITFQCRGGSAYQRVYRSRDGTHYPARCPRCGRSVRFAVGAGGTNSRAFQVECG